MKIISINYRNVIFRGFALGLCLTTGSGLFAASDGERKVEIAHLTAQKRTQASNFLKGKVPGLALRFIEDLVNNLTDSEITVLLKLSPRGEAYDAIFQELFGSALEYPRTIEETLQEIRSAFAEYGKRNKKKLQELSAQQSSSERKVEIAQDKEKELGDVWQMGLEPEVKKQEENKAAALQEAEARQAITIPHELRSLIRAPEAIPGIMLPIAEEITLTRFSIDHRSNFAYDVWQELSEEVQQALRDSGSTELTRQAHMIFLRTILAKIPDFDVQPRGGEKREYQKNVVRETAQIINKKVDSVVTDIRQRMLARVVNIPDFVGQMLTFIDDLDRKRETLGDYESPDIKVSNSRLFHAAMLTRLVAMLDNASTNDLEREYLYDLLADSLLQNGIKEAYKRLAKLVSINYRALAVLYLMPTLIPFAHYTLYPSVKMLQAKAQNLSNSGILDPIEVNKRAEAFAAPRQAVFFSGMKAAEELVEIFEIATKEENFAARKKLVMLLRATQDEHVRQEYAILHHKPSVSQANKLKLNELIRTAFIFGPQHAYENLNAGLGVIERSWAAKPDPKIKTEWKDLLEQFTLDYWTPETLSMGKKIKIEPPELQMVSKIKRIRRLRGIFDQAGDAKNENAQRLLIHIIHEIAKPTALQPIIEQYVYLADAFSNQEGYKRLLGILGEQSRLNRLYSTVTAKIPFQKSLLAQWHDAIEGLYQSGRVLAR